MEKIEYFNPKENIKRGEFEGHSFDIVIEGKKIGSAEISYFSKPIPLYQLTDLYVDFEEKGRGFASKLMDEFEVFLRERRKPGILVDAIIDGDSASGMYERRGWIKVPNSTCLYVFNWPSDVNMSILDGYSSRYTDIMERSGTGKG